MEASRHALRRNPSGPDRLPPGAVELPSFGADELNDFQASVPMPERARPPRRDRETTEALGAPGDDARPAREAVVPALPKPLERTQPISLACFSGQRRRSARREARDPVRFELASPPPPPDALPARRPDRQPAPGDVFCGRYVVIRKVDHYGMGLVYKARDRQRKRAGSPMPWVALKFARPGSGTGTETRRLLRQEFLKLSQLNHPNVVKVYDLASDAGTEFIVMEWLSGETLASLLARITARRLALEKAIEIVRCTARGLAHAHDLGIVHGDVKPSNIFLTNNREVKLLDFGSSGTTSADVAGPEPERNWATRAYASPQVLEGEAPQPHDDVFALGVTAWCLLSGDRPFGERDALAARAEGVEPPPLPPDAHEQWPAVRSALQFEAIDRPQHARLFVRELDERGDESARQPPLVVDVDANSRSEILIVANDVNACSGLVDDYVTRRGLFVYEDPNDRWVRTRSIWNQHAYSNDNILDSGAVPATQAASWATHNTFRANRQGEIPLNAPDVVVGSALVNARTCPTHLYFQATIQNKGTSGVPAGLPVSLYQVDPSALIETIALPAPLAPGGTTIVRFEYEVPYELYNRDLSFTILANDPLGGEPFVADCHPESATKTLEGVRCALPL